MADFLFLGVLCKLDLVKGLFVNPSLKRCPFRRQCPVSPTTPIIAGFCLILTARLFYRHRDYVSACAYLSPLKESKSFQWSLFGQFLTAFLATPVNIMPAGSGPVSRRSDPSVAN